MVLKLIQNGSKLVPIGPKWSPPPHPHPWRQQKSPARGQTNMKKHMFELIALIDSIAEHTNDIVSNPIVIFIDEIINNLFVNSPFDEIRNAYVSPSIPPPNIANIVFEGELCPFVYLDLTAGGTACNRFVCNLSSRNDTAC